MQRVVFCDFDGTITSEETFAGMLKDFAPELSAELMPQMYALKLTLREGVRRLLESIPSARYPEILAYARSRAIRPGFAELLDFLDDRGAPFVVVSGGLAGMVREVLGSFVDRAAALYAVDLDTSGEYCKALSQVEGDTELVSKVRVMEMHPAEEAIAIGDSVTDLNMALRASTVFARDRLARYLDERQVAYIPWNDFHDIRAHLEKSWAS